MNAMREIRTLGVALGAAALAGAWAACRPADGETAASGGEAGGAPAGARVVNVEVTPLALSDFSDYVRATGEAEAMSDVTLSAEEAGVVKRVFVEKGTVVKTGAPLIKIDDEVLAAQVAEARAAATLTREQYERQQRVWAEEKVGSEIGLLQARSAADGAAARLAALEARLERTVIRSPVDGVFDERSVDVGEMVMPGTRVGRVVAAQRIKITAGIPERYAAALRTGAEARVTFDILPDRPFRGLVGFVGASVDPSNRTFPIELVIDNPGGVIKPRMVANVQVERLRLPAAMVVSQDVVLRTENGYQVFVVVDEDGGAVARARPVELGPSFENRVVIAGGLNVGDRVVTVGQRLVDEGSHVRVLTGQEGER